MAANRQINYIKPSEPSFLAKFKKDVGYKEGPTVNTKGRKLVARSELVPYDFSREQEEELVEWYRSNTELYDKNHEHHRNRERKNSLLRNKAKEFPECTYAQLCLWLKSQRTRYGKLSQLRGKSNGRKFTPREQWIIDKWGFIKTHIVRITQVDSRQCTEKLNNRNPLCSTPSGEQCEPSRAASGCAPTASHRQLRSKRRRTTASSSAPTPAGSTLTPTGSTPLPAGPIHTGSTHTGSTPTGSTHTGSTHTGSTHTGSSPIGPTTSSSTLLAPEGEDGEANHQQLIKLLLQQLVGRELRPALPCSPHERAIDAFLAFLKTELLKIPENVWFNYTIEAMRLAQSYTYSHQQQLLVETSAPQSPSPELSSSAASGADWACRLLSPEGQQRFNTHQPSP